MGRTMHAVTLVSLSGVSLAWSGDVFFKTDNTRRLLVPWSSPDTARLADLEARPTAYHWAAFTGALDESARSWLTALGVELLGFAGRPGPYQLYKVRIQGEPARVLDSLKGLPSFVNLLPILPEEKVSRKLFQGRFERGLPGGKVKASVYFHRLPTRTQAEAQLKDRVDSLYPDADPRLYHVVASPAGVLALTRLDEVARVEDFLEKRPLRSSGG